MISVAELRERAAEWQLPEETVEKDYVLGWVLWGIANEPRLSDTWAFKGGTCLKKCYIETYRFSEDLDFTVLEGGLLDPDELVTVFQALLARVNAQCGIDFSGMIPRFRMRPMQRSVEGSIYYRGPRNHPTVARIKFDLTADEPVICPPVLRTVQHPYSDALPEPNMVRCYGFEEVFAEKLRAMGERSRPRDLFDIITLFRREDLRAFPRVIREVLVQKCVSKRVPVPTHDLLLGSPHREELESEWANMLGRQLPALPPFSEFWNALPTLFDWLEERAVPATLPAFPMSTQGATDWSPPPTMWFWGSGVPLETIRFAGANQLCVDLGYQGTVRRIEPYSLRRTLAGDVLLYAVRADNGEVRSYRVDRIQSVRVTQLPFTPRYATEFTAYAQLVPTSFSTLGRHVAIPRRAPTVVRSRSAGSKGPAYMIQCPSCGKRFSRKSRDMTLRDHKSKGNDWKCNARRGFLVETHC